MNVVQTIVDEAKELRSDGRGKLLLLIAIPWGLLTGARMIYPVLLPDIQATFGLSLTAAGLLITILWLCGAIGQFPGGIFADRYSEHRIMAISVIIVAIAIGMIIVATEALFLFVATGIWGFGHSLYPIARITILSDIYPSRIGSSLGVTMATGDIGQTVLPPIAAVLTAAIAWQLGFGIVIPFLILSGILIWFVFPDHSPKKSAVDTLSMETVRYIFTMLRQPIMVFIALILFLYALMWQAFTAFYPTYLVTIKGLSPTMAAILFGLFFAIGVVVKPVSGSIYDRAGIRTALMFTLLGPIVGFFLLPVVSDIMSLIVVTVLVSTMLGTGTITQSFLADKFPRDMRGSGLGSIRSVVFTLSSIGPVLFGAIADHGYFDEGYILLALIIIFILILTLRMPR